MNSTNLVSTSKWRRNNAIKSISLFGDVRFRYEYRSGQNFPAVTGYPQEAYSKDIFLKAGPVLYSYTGVGYSNSNNQALGENQSFTGQGFAGANLNNVTVTTVSPSTRVPSMIFWYWKCHSEFQSWEIR